MSKSAKTALWKLCENQAIVARFEEVTGQLANACLAPTVLFCFKRELAAGVERFRMGFPGRVAFAVKSMPHEAVVRYISECGIADYDVASLNEIRLIREMAPGSRLHFNNPVKTTPEIVEAYAEHGVRSFTIDSAQELRKFASLGYKDATIALRLDVPAGSAMYNFGTKFGCGGVEAANLARSILGLTGHYALSFHVGSQCSDSRAYSLALKECRKLADELGVEPAHVNVGGGFPVPSEGDVAKVTETCLQEIRASAASMGFDELICEPGRAIAGPSGVAAMQVRRRSRDRVFLSDGVYGLLGEVNYLACDFPIGCSLRGKEGTMSKFRMFGPTCDSYDQIDRAAFLKETIDEGDWIFFGNMGAYSWSLANSFNGFSERALILL